MRIKDSRQVYSIGDYVWFSWYRGEHIAGIIDDCFHGTKSVWYRIRGRNENFNGVLQTIIDHRPFYPSAIVRPMRVDEIVQQKLNGLTIGEDSNT